MAPSRPDYVVGQRLRLRKSPYRTRAAQPGRVAVVSSVSPHYPYDSGPLLGAVLEDEETFFFLPHEVEPWDGLRPGDLVASDALGREGEGRLVATDDPDRYRVVLTSGPRAGDVVDVPLADLVPLPAAD